MPIVLAEINCSLCYDTNDGRPVHDAIAIAFWTNKLQPIMIAAAAYLLEPN